LNSISADGGMGNEAI